MSGAFTSASVDIGDVEQGLDAMQRRARQLGPAFQAIKAEMKADQKDHREQQEGPDGKWAPRAASTLAAAKHQRSRNRKLPKGKRRSVPRKILGKLPTAVAYRALPYGAVGESRVGWSLAQQDGGRVGRGAVLPARPFLWLSDRLLVAAEKIVESTMLDAYGGVR